MCARYEFTEFASAAMKKVWVRIGIVCVCAAVIVGIACVVPISMRDWQDRGRGIAVSEATANLTGARLSVELFVFRYRKAPKTLQEADASLTGRCYRAEDYEIVVIEQKDGRVLRAELRVNHRDQYPSVVLFFGDLIASRVDVIEP